MRTSGKSKLPATFIIAGPGIPREQKVHLYRFNIGIKSKLHRFPHFQVAVANVDVFHKYFPEAALNANQVAGETTLHNSSIRIYPKSLWVLRLVQKVGKVTTV